MIDADIALLERNNDEMRVRLDALTAATEASRLLREAARRLEALPREERIQQAAARVLEAAEILSNWRP